MNEVPANRNASRSRAGVSVGRRAFSVARWTIRGQNSSPRSRLAKLVQPGFHWRWSRGPARCAGRARLGPPKDVHDQRTGPDEPDAEPVRIIRGVVEQAVRYAYKHAVA